MMNDNVVVTLDYYTLDQARKIIYAEMQADREKLISIARYKRKKKIELIKLTIGLFLTLIALPLGMCIHWLVVGY